MDAATRSSILASYAHAFAEIPGAAPAEDAESAGSRFVAWLAEADQPWLVVLDDLTNAADLAGLWPQRPAGCVLVTAQHGASLPGEFGAMAWPVGLLSAREALAYVLARLPSDPDQRAGVADLGRALLAAGRPGDAVSALEDVARARDRSSIPCVPGAISPTPTWPRAGSRTRSGCTSARLPDASGSRSPVTRTP